MKLYTSDQHLAHKNIIQYTRRPFNDIEQMNGVLLEHLRAAERTGADIVHCGDLTFDLFRFLERYGPIFQSPVGKLIVLGNHDRTGGKTENANHVRREAYETQFATVVGHEKDWKRNMAVIEDVLEGRPVQVLVSHAPQENLWGCDLNVHGHIHNNVLLPPQEAHHPEDQWTIESPVHFCACVELHGFKPVTLDQLAQAHRTRYVAALADLAPLTP